MALQTTDFSTGPATSVDIGVLSYNGCLFSPLFTSNLSGKVVKDNARRTTKYVRYLLTVDGYVTLPDNEESVNSRTQDLRLRLTAVAGELFYQGRGIDILVNTKNGIKDLAWGPIPELLEFQPLGAGRSAKVQWQVEFCIPEILPGNNLVKIGAGPALPSILQFSYETSISYDASGYSTVGVKGILEVAMTRSTQATKSLTNTVDDLRFIIETRLMAAVDLSRFTVIKRNFNISNDKRFIEWNFEIEEKGYMDLPPDITVARGTYSVRPAKAGMGLCTWLCTLKANYVVRADRPRRTAWFAFLSLLRLRMSESQRGIIPKLNGDQNPKKKGFIKQLIDVGITVNTLGIFNLINDSLNKESKLVKDAFLVDFSFDEGIYLDSKTVSFSATWRLVTGFSHILLASGLWTKLPEYNANNENLWAISVKNISGSKSWLENKIDPKLDVIVDFGG